MLHSQGLSKNLYPKPYKVIEPPNCMTLGISCIIQILLPIHVEIREQMEMDRAYFKET
jgi:hypothetical protein